MKKITSLILAALLGATCFLFVACQKKQTPPSVIPQENILYDFEDYDRNFSLMRVMTYFGAVKVNTDTQYVRSGKVSALLQPLGYHSTMIGNVFTPTLAPESCLYIPFQSVKYDFDYTDAAHLNQVRMAVYNAEATDKNMYVGLVFERNVQEVCEPTKFTLRPGWNDVLYVVEHDRLVINYDLGMCYGLALSFDRVGSRYLKDAPKIYLDDIRIDTTEAAVTPNDLVELDAGELCDFEKGYQRYAFTSGVYDKARRPDLEIVTATSAGIAAPSGHRILKTTIKPVDAIDGTIYDYVYLRQGIIDKANIGSYAQSAKVCFDVYNADDDILDLSITFVSTRNANSYVVTGHINAAPKQWMTYSIAIEEINRKFDEAFNVANLYSTQPGPIRIAYPEFTGTANKTVYFDNFRIEG